MIIPERPMLKPWYRVRREEDRVLLEYGHRLVVLEGGATQRLLPALLPLLDGRRTLDEIAAYLGEPIAPAVRAALEALVRAGALTEGPPLSAELSKTFGSTAELLSAAFGGELGPAKAAERLERSTVGMAGTGALAEEVARLLRLSGVGSLERVPATDAHQHLRTIDLVVAVVSHARPDLPDELNRACFPLSLPWLPVTPFDGVLAAVGPLVVPGESACWRCVRLRRASAIGYADEVPSLERVPATPPSSPPLDAMVAGLSATLALRWLVQRDPALPGLLLALEQWPRPRLTGHTVYRVPRCPVCSELAGRAAPAPWSEESAA